MEKERDTAVRGKNPDEGAEETGKIRGGCRSGGKLELLICCEHSEFNKNLLCFFSHGAFYSNALCHVYFCINY